MTCNTDASGLPPERFITDPAKLDHYSRDATPGISCRPEAVCLPKTVAEVESVLKWAFSEKIPVTCRGAGTGNSGGAIPVQKGLVLSLEKLNRILEVDVDNRVARVEPGVITEHLQNRVLEEGLFYPPDPASLSVCTIGGNVAENAGGPRAVKYGVTKDYVIGLAGFFVNGEPFKFGGKQYKNVAGYDLIRLLVGSEGTLGVITEVTVRLLSNPPVTQDLIVGFPDYQTALRGMRTVLTSSITPAVVEFMDAYCVTVTARYLEIPVPVKSASVYLLFQQDGSSVGNVLDQIEKIRSLCDSSGAIFSRVLEGETCQSVWRVRREISRALKDLSPNKIAQDVVVPPAEIPDFMSYLKALGQQSNGCRILGYGHFGDGNIHVNLLEGKMDLPTWRRVGADLSRQLYEKAVVLGGTITGEHGVGITKKSFLPMVFSAEELALLKRIKLAFDPEGLLNPGKIFDVNPFGDFEGNSL